MGSYSIKDLERLSGIKAHTIRIWEQRYSLLKPKRTDTNIRYYNDVDLKLVLNIAALRANGQKISRIAGMTHDEICQYVSEIANEGNVPSQQVSTLVVAMSNFDEKLFEKVYSNSVAQVGVVNTLKQVIFPFLNNIGLLWQTSAILPIQEHFISNLIRRKIQAAIDSVSNRTFDKALKFMLFLPEKEYHELGLMFAEYLIKSKGHKALYLGQSLPLLDLKTGFEIFKPDYILTVFSGAIENSSYQSLINFLSHEFSECKVLVAGSDEILAETEFPNKMQFLGDFDQLIKLLEEV